MLRSTLAAIAVLALGATAVMAHHKPGHSPPGHSKQFARPGQFTAPKLTLEDAVPLQFDVTVDDGDRGIDWRRYEDPDYEFSIDLPLGLFEAADDPKRGLRLREVGGDGLLEVYGGDNAQDLAPEDFVAVLEGDPQIGEITYRASGPGWFALSGYYSRDGYVGDALIFYAKFMFSADLARVSAFEISYPLQQKPLFDDIVERLEDSLSRPS